MAQDGGSGVSPRLITVPALVGMQKPASSTATARRTCGSPAKAALSSPATARRPERLKGQELSWGRGARQAPRVRRAEAQSHGFGRRLAACRENNCGRLPRSRWSPSHERREVRPAVGEKPVARYASIRGSAPTAILPHPALSAAPKGADQASPPARIRQQRDAVLLCSPTTTSICIAGCVPRSPGKRAPRRRSLLCLGQPQSARSQRRPSATSRRRGASRWRASRCSDRRSASASLRRQSSHEPEDSPFRPKVAAV